MIRWRPLLSAKERRPAYLGWVVGAVDGVVEGAVLWTLVGPVLGVWRTASPVLSVEAPAKSMYAMNASTARPAIMAAQPVPERAASPRCPARARVFMLIAYLIA